MGVYSLYAAMNHKINLLFFQGIHLLLSNIENVKLNDFKNITDKYWPI